MATAVRVRRAAVGWMAWRSCPSLRLGFPRITATFTSITTDGRTGETVITLGASATCSEASAVTPSTAASGDPPNRYDRSTSDFRRGPG